MKPRPLFAAIAVAIAAGPAAAQDASLERAEARLEQGDYATARQLVDLWLVETMAGRQPEGEHLLARGLLLRAILAPEPAQAERDYLAIVLGHPRAPQAAEALLRLGQGLLAAGDADRAAAYLERLVIDYPDSEHRATALLWFARARQQTGRPEAACAASRTALAGPTPDTTVLALLRREETRACALAAQRTTERGPDADRAPAPDHAARPPVASLSVQAGAFRDETGAAALAAQLRAAGFEPRLVQTPGSDLVRVRIGRFTDDAQTADLGARLRSAGFDAIRVTDADQERPR